MNPDDSHDISAPMATASPPNGAEGVSGSSEGGGGDDNNRTDDGEGLGAGNETNIPVDDNSGAANREQNSESRLEDISSIKQARRRFTQSDGRNLQRERRSATTSTLSGDDSGRHVRGIIASSGLGGSLSIEKRLLTECSPGQPPTPNVNCPGTIPARSGVNDVALSTVKRVVQDPRPDSGAVGDDMDALIVWPGERENRNSSEMSTANTINSPRFALGRPGAHHIFTHRTSTGSVRNVEAESIEEGPILSRSPLVRAVQVSADVGPTQEAEKLEPTNNASRARFLVAAAICCFVSVAVTVLAVVFTVGSDRSSAPSRESLLRGFISRQLPGDSIFQLGTPQDMAAQWILFNDTMQLSLEDKNLLQRYILALLYFHSTVPGEKVWEICNPPIGEEDELCFGDGEVARWLSGRDECDWYGVSCDSGSNTIKIALNSTGLVRSIPSELSGLTALTFLELSFNDISGRIPEDIFGLSNLVYLNFEHTNLSGSLDTKLGQLSSLELFLCGFNLLSGTIPSEIGNLSRLQTLGLHDTRDLGGPIPSELFGLSSLVWLSLEGNHLSGSLSTFIGKLTNLASLLLERNKLTGSFPSELGNCSNLRQIELGNNVFTGTLTSELGKLTHLETISMFNNSNLSGTVPESLYRLTALHHLDFSLMSLSGTVSSLIGNMSNLRIFQISRNMLSGSIPSEIGKLVRLSALEVEGNKITGSLPEEFYNLEKLSILLLRQTQLSGKVSSQIGRLTALSQIILSGNALTGPIPSELGKCSGLSRVAFDGNDFLETIPSEIGGLLSLSHLDLEGNKRLSGSIPDQMYRLTLLEFLSLSGMSLTGTISSAIRQMELLKSLSFSQNKLRDALPSEVGSLSNLRTLAISDNNLFGPIPDDLYSLNQLNYLDLSENSFIGKLSTLIGKLSDLVSLNIQDNELSGTIPSQVGSLSRLRTFSFSGNRLTGRVPQVVCDRRTNGVLQFLQADCAPVDDPPIACECCTVCCRQENGVCRSEGL